MKKLFIALMVVLGGCGQAPEEQTISDDLLEYVERFKTETGIEFQNTDVILADIPDNDLNEYPVINGSCYQGIGVNVVLISLEFNNWKEEKRENIIAHELGHCLFGIPHTEKLLNDECPASIMFPHSIDPECWKKHKEEYYKEMIEQYKTFGSF